MSAIDYAEIADDVLAAIEDAGAPAVLKRTAVEYDVATGEADGQTKSFDGAAVRVDYKNSEIDGSMILVGDVRFFLSAVNMIEPKTGDSLVFDSQTFSVIECKPIKPATIAVAYIVQARKG